VSVVYYVPTDDDELLVSTTAARGKARAVARDGKVGLCVLDERWPFVYLQVYADAVVDRDRELVVDVMMAVAERMSGQRLGHEAPFTGRGDGGQGGSSRRALSPVRDLRPAPSAPIPKRPSGGDHPLGVTDRPVGRVSCGVMQARPVRQPGVTL
jgi:hypothetical protein